MRGNLSEPDSKTLTDDGRATTNASPKTEYLFSGWPFEGSAGCFGWHTKSSLHVGLC